ncbi:MAG TPA: DUF1287 domain-containing protein [Pyrinomonadaceae bacterium]|jgi:hypothetical protein
MKRIEKMVFVRCSIYVLLLLLSGCGVASSVSQTVKPVGKEQPQPPSAQQQDVARVRSSGSPALDKLAEAAIERTSQKVRYDPTYFVLEYPGGDPPAEVGVCTDEVIRSYRKLGIDLQKEVHEDMRRNFDLYPKKWGLRKPDTNIDHRRVPNLMVFFARKGDSLSLSLNAADYAPGDIVTWDLGGGLTHIGIVVGVASSADPARLLIVHNIGAGPQMEDVLFNWKITGHYRYTGTKK